MMKLICTIVKQHRGVSILTLARADIAMAVCAVIHKVSVLYMRSGLVFLLISLVIVAVNSINAGSNHEKPNLQPNMRAMHT